MIEHINVFYEGKVVGVLNTSNEKFMELMANQQKFILHPALDIHNQRAIELTDDVLEQEVISILSPVYKGLQVIFEGEAIRLKIGGTSVKFKSFDDFQKYVNRKEDINGNTTSSSERGSREA